jgi:hypothetical protein
MTTHTITVVYDKTLDEYVLPLGDELCKQLGWTVGDTLIWIDNKDGTYTVKKQNG